MLYVDSAEKPNRWGEIPEKHGAPTEIASSLA
jgi:hypothetical protein